MSGTQEDDKIREISHSLLFLREGREEVDVKQFFF